MMEELLRLTRENNIMLRDICSKLHSTDEDLKNFIINVIANSLTTNL